MTNPIVHSFFVGRALAETLYERAEASLTNALSDLGKLDAELREELRQFTEQVMAGGEPKSPRSGSVRHRRRERNGRSANRN